MGWGWSPLLYLFFWILVGSSSLEVFLEGRVWNARWYPELLS